MQRALFTTIILIVGCYKDYTMKTYSLRYFGIILACTLSLFLLTATQTARADTVTTSPQASIAGKQMAFYYGYYRRPGFIYFRPGPRYYRNYYGGWRYYGGCRRSCIYNRWGAPVQCVRRCY